MKRKIIKIDEEKCIGCGLCVSACHEGAIEMINGKAKLTKEDYCDGLGDCLPSCPVNAIAFEEREALEYNEEKVNQTKKQKTCEITGGCPGSKEQQRTRTNQNYYDNPTFISTELINWPIQIKLVPTNASFFDGAKILIAADCTAYTYANFHKEFMHNHVTLIGCPKLDGVDYTNKLVEIFKNNNIRSVKVVRMEVPCCGGIENACRNALMNSGKFIPWQVITISTKGEIID